MPLAPEATPATPKVASILFGSRLGLAEHYVRLLASTGIEHGLVGPAEHVRLWDRHVLNCAAIAPGFDEAAHVVDIGSGAGLPGVVLAIARPDLQLTLVEPLARRTTWLSRAVAEMGLGNVQVHTGRAESLYGLVRARHTTARAVARLRLLAQWSLPLLEAGGSLVAIKGATASAELDEDREALCALGAASMRVETYGTEVLRQPTCVVRVGVDVAPPARSAGRPAGSRRIASRQPGSRRRR